MTSPAEIVHLISSAEPDVPAKPLRPVGGRLRPTLPAMRGRCGALRSCSCLIWLLILASGARASGADVTPLAPRAPAGFSVERVAAQPDVRFPMFAAFDERGRLFVAESSGLDLYAELSALTRKCQVRLLEDRNADGRFDVSRVFVDGLVFPMGLAWRDGKLYVADPPDLVTFEDTDGDGRADRRRVLLTGFGHRDNGSLHGLIFGPDGWLYLTMGEPDGYRLLRADGSFLEGGSGALLRCRPDGSGIEVLCRGFENLVEISFTPGGERIGTDNWFQQPVGGIRDALVHLIEGGLYPYAADSGTPQPITGPPLPAVSLFPAVALSGLTSYRGTSFPAAMRGNLFSAQHNSRKIGRHTLHREGATWRTDDFDFVTCDDPDFHPSDVLEDADGSLLVVDTGSWYTQHCPTGRIRKSPAAGGIYRVRAAEGPGKVVDDPRGLREDWKRMSITRALELLADTRPAVQDRAQGVLTATGPSMLRALGPWLIRETNRQARLHGLWTLAQAGPFDGLRAGRGDSADLFRTLLDDSDIEVAAAAARVLALWPNQNLAGALTKCLQRPDPPLRLATAQALARGGTGDSVPHLWHALTNTTDAFLAHGLIHAIHLLADEKRLRRALTNPHPRVQEAALLLLAQPPRVRTALEPEMVLTRLESADMRLRQTALTLLRQRNEWAPFASDLLRPLPDQPAGNSSLRLPPGAWRELFLAFETNVSVQTVVGEALKSTRAPALLPVLEALTRSALAKPPPGWLDGINVTLTHPDPEVRLHGVRAAGRWPLEAWSDRLLGMAESPREPVTLRLEAARAQAVRQPELTPKLFSLLLEALAPSGDPVLALVAADILSRCHLSDVQLIKVFAVLGDSPLLPPTKFLRAFRTSVSDADALALVDVVKRKLDGGWPADETEFRAFLVRLPEPARRRAEPLSKGLRSDLEEQRARLSQFTPLLGNGRTDSGRALFFSPKAGCAVCHAVGSQGGRLGPDLTRIGATRSGQDLLESIVFPSATFAQGYESYTLHTRDGGEWNGLLLEQLADSVLLREATGVERRFRREEIQDLRRDALSLMPEGLERGLTADEFRDLLAFLQDLR